MKKFIFVFVALITFGAFLAFAEEPVLIHNGFLTGNDYLEKPLQQRTFYAVGIIDGMLLSPLFGAPKNELSWFESCVTGMTGDQVAAIISKYLENHPGEWHQSLHTTTFRAMKEACRQ